MILKKDIVKEIIKGVKIPILTTKIIPETETQPFSLDDKINYKSILTDFINEYFLSSYKETNKLIETVFKVITPLIDEYIKEKKLNDNDIIFIYKAGNLMKRLFDNTNHLLFGKISDILEFEYSSAFGRSDNDFQILINPFIDNYEETYDQINTLVYYGLDYIRNIIEQNKSFYFSYMNLSDEQKRALLNTIKNKFPDKVVNITLSKKNDILVDNEKISDITNNAKLLSISYNKNLLFERGVEHINFSLIRIRINFMLTFDKKPDTIMFGEHTDISISRKEDGFFKHFNINNSKDFYNFIKLFIYNTKSPYKYSTTNLNYLILDILKVLFSEDVWLNVKYDKRLKRLFYLSLLSEISQEQLTNKKLDDIISNFSKLKDSIKTKRKSNINYIMNIINDNIIKQLDSNDKRKEPFLNKVLSYININIRIIEDIKKQLNKFSLDNVDIFNITTFN